MRKSVNRPQFVEAAHCLLDLRQKAGLSQIELASRIRYTQSYVSAVEIGFRRLDLLQLHDWCTACGTNLETLGKMVDGRLAAWAAARAIKKKSPPPKRTKKRMS
jgi:transcriptional regulator with XRE-family HTH domain